jgi:hypothetical protein
MGKFQQKFSQRQERELEAEWPLAHRTVGSGNKWEKGDLSTEEQFNVSFVVEAKATQAASFSITKKIWDTIKEHAHNRSWLARPILAIRLYGPTIEKTGWGGERENTPENLPVELDLICMDKNDFLELYYDYLRLKEKETK